MPPAVQVSAVVELHDWQTLPAEPQRANVGVVTQAVPSQQPVGHEFAAHEHTPPSQRRPGPQAGPAPHIQVPVAEQPSAATMSHPMQTAPPIPQVAIDTTLQVAPEQQPLVQVAEHPLQRPSVQVCPEGQASQELPPVPHELALSPPRHNPFWQQPSAQDVPSQTQVLPRQRWPRAHATPVPQRQAPAAEQLSERASQTAQLEPASPQVAKDRVSHRSFLQQPLGQEVASQMQRPPAHRCPPAQAGPTPHRQSPVGPQIVAFVASHAAHALPAAPQVVTDGALHTTP